MLILRCGESVCTLFPTLGGSIGEWSVCGQEMFRAAGAAAIEACDPLGMASFPLVPYSNRIGDALFEWAGEAIRLTPNFAPEPHTIHGVGWTTIWTVSGQSEGEATLTFSHVGNESWPWPFEAQQQIRLTENQLSLALRVRNLAPHPVPLAFGHHPYFDADGAMVAFSAKQVWMTGDDALPYAPTKPSGQFDFTTARPIEGQDIDHCYAGVSGPTRIHWLGRVWALEISSSPQLTAAVVYASKGGDAFCFEPVPHINNALNLPGHEPAMPVIPPGEAFATTITFKAILL